MNKYGPQIEFLFSKGHVVFWLYENEFNLHFDENL